MFKPLALIAFAALTALPTTTSAQAERKSYDISCEICQMKDGAGVSCKGRVTRGTSSASGVNYTCSNGHKFVVKSKIRIN